MVRGGTSCSSGRPFGPPLSSNTVVQTDHAPSAEVIGVYAVDAPVPCALVEMRVRRTTTQVDLDDVTQAVEGVPESEWQVVWDEHFLDATGSKPLDARHPAVPPSRGDVRVAFFLHYLDDELPLSTPWGNLPLPAVTDRPDRLSFMAYEPPC